MAAKDQFLVCIAALLLLIRQSSSQNRIVFPAEDYEATGNRFPARIPEKLLTKLNNVHSVADFLRKFVEPKEHIIEDSGQFLLLNGSERAAISGRKASRGRKKLIPKELLVPPAEPAKCKPVLQIVHVPQPAAPAWLRWPNCVRVKRCGGCCWGGKNACTPTQISFENFTVAEVYYDSRDPDHFQNAKPIVISVEQHNKCACKCSQQNCGEFQKYDDDSCRCVCPNKNLASKCTHQHKIWDDLTCSCKCRNKTVCSTGRYFDEEKCKCEIMKY